MEEPQTTSLSLLDCTDKGNEKGVTSIVGQEAIITDNTNLLDRLCCVYDNPITNTSIRRSLSIRQVADLIRGDIYAPQTQILRTIQDKASNREYKSTQFHYATFSGVFAPSRAAKNLVQHSGLICIDIDHLAEKLHEVKTIVNSDPSTVMSFISPNGDGLKVIYEMIPGKHTQEQYYKIYTAYLNQLCSLELRKIDSSCSDVSRACFLPCDPEIFINPYFTTL